MILYTEDYAVIAVIREIISICHLTTPFRSYIKNEGGMYISAMRYLIAYQPLGSVSTSVKLGPPHNLS